MLKRHLPPLEHGQRQSLLRGDLLDNDFDTDEVIRFMSPDANGLCWIDVDGTFHRCTPAACASSQRIWANGQSKSANLYQDSTALYWFNAESGQIMRIAK
jgi:hypothetical protein